jgi:hypothetical protein
MDNEQYIRELLRWVKEDSILVIDKNSSLRRIYCPFKAVCLVEFPDIRQGEKVAVMAVKLTMSVKEVYIIKGRAYFIIYFRILPEG